MIAASLQGPKLPPICAERPKKVLLIIKSSAKASNQGLIHLHRLLFGKYFDPTMFQNPQRETRLSNYHAIRMDAHGEPWPRHPGTYRAVCLLNLSSLKTELHCIFHMPNL